MTSNKKRTWTYLRDELDSGKVPPKIRGRFEKFPNETELTVAKEDDTWRIKAKKEPEETEPTVVKEDYISRIKAEEKQRTYLVREVWFWQHWWQEIQNVWGIFRHRLGKRRTKIILLFKTISARELRPEDNKTISKDLESKFKAAGINLPKAFEIYVKEKGKEWDIIECIQPLQEGSSQHNTGVYKSIAKRISDDQALPNDKKSPSDPEITIPRSRIQAYHIEYRGDEYIITKKQSRAYRTTPLPTLRKDRRVKGQGNDELLAKLYSEICSSWRQLTEVRFKLLGLVPAVSIAILISLFARPKQGEGLSPTTQTVIAIFGLVITYALYIYERRNSELYDDLISRGRKIEAEMGIETGQFLGRKTPSAKTLFFLRVEHDTAIKAIYYTAIVIWLGAVVYIWRERLPSYLYDPIHHFLNV